MWGRTHRLVLQRMGTTDPDAEGRGGRAVIATSEWDGSVSFVSSQEAEVAARFGERVDAVARLPRESGASARDRIVVDDPENPALDGTWEITTVRWTPLHLRCLLRRPEGTR